MLFEISYCVELEDGELYFVKIRYEFDAGEPTIRHIFIDEPFRFNEDVFGTDHISAATIFKIETYIKEMHDDDCEAIEEA